MVLQKLLNVYICPSLIPCSVCVYVCVSHPLVTESFLKEVLLIAEVCWELLSPLSISPSPLFFSCCNIFLFMTLFFYCSFHLSCHLSLSQILFILNLFCFVVSWGCFHAVSFVCVSVELTHRGEGRIYVWCNLYVHVHLYQCWAVKHHFVKHYSHNFFSNV